jgi:magnesium transporter
MTKHANQITSVSALMGAPVADSGGRVVGHVREFAVRPAEDANHVKGLVLKLNGAARASRSRRSPILSWRMRAACGCASRRRQR